MDSLLDLTYPMIYLILVCLNHPGHLFSKLHIFASFSHRTFEVLYPVSFNFPENPVTPHSLSMATQFDTVCIVYTAVHDCMV